MSDIWQAPAPTHQEQVASGGITETDRRQAVTPVSRPTSSYNQEQMGLPSLSDNGIRRPGFGEQINLRYGEHVIISTPVLSVSEGVSYVDIVSVNTSPSGGQSLQPVSTPPAFFRFRQVVVSQPPPMPSLSDAAPTAIADGSNNFVAVPAGMVASGDIFIPLVGLPVINTGDGVLEPILPYGYFVDIGLVPGMRTLWPTPN